MKTALETFVAHLNSVIVTPEGLQEKTIKAKPGRKYIKLINVEGGRDSSVYCFVEAATGDILKAESWSKPARHARGNINDPETYKNADQFGSWLYMY